MIFMQTAGQAITQGIPFTVYGESLIIMVQNFLIILLIWNYNKTVGFIEKAFVSVFFIAYGYTMFKTSMITPELWTLISSSSSLLSKYIIFTRVYWSFCFVDIIAKVPQILTNFRNKSTGQMAFFTFLLSFLGSVARLGTVMVESDDFMFRLQYIISVLLNSMIIL